MHVLRRSRRTKVQGLYGWIWLHLWRDWRGFHPLLQIAEQDRVIGLQRFAQSQLISAPVCTARIDPAMHGAIGFFGRRVAYG
jgi:hypothetical protein